MSEQVSVSVDDLEFIQFQIKRIWNFFDLCQHTLEIVECDDEETEEVLGVVVEAMKTINEMFAELYDNPVFDKIKEKKESEVQ